MNGNGGGDYGSSGYGGDNAYGFDSSGYSSDAALSDGLGYSSVDAAFSGDPAPAYAPPVDQFSYSAPTESIASGPIDYGNPASTSDSSGGLGSSILSGLESAGSFFGGLGSDLLSGIGSIGSTLGGIGSDLLGGAAGAVSGLVSGLGGSKAVGNILGNVLRSHLGATTARGALTSAYGGYNGRAPTAAPFERMISARNLGSALISRPKRRNRSAGAYGQPAPIPFTSCA